MTAEWDPPEDEGEFAAWMDNFLEKLPKHAKELGIGPDEVEALQKCHADFRSAFLKDIRLKLIELRRRLRAFCPPENWPAVFVEAFARLPITKEPDRSELLRLLEKWIAGIERAHGGMVRPKLSWQYFSEGIDLQFTIPKPCEGTSVFYRLKGRAAWQFLITNTQPGKRMYTAPEYLGDEEQKSWPGSTLEFIAFGWFETASFGFPSEKVAIVVPVSYPITAEH